MRKIFLKSIARLVLLVIFSLIIFLTNVSFSRPREIVYLQDIIYLSIFVVIVFFKIPHRVVILFLTVLFLNQVLLELFGLKMFASFISEVFLFSSIVIVGKKLYEKYF